MTEFDLWFLGCFFSICVMAIGAMAYQIACDIAELENKYKRKDDT